MGTEVLRRNLRNLRGDTVARLRRLPGNLLAVLVIVVVFIIIAMADLAVAAWVLYRKLRGLPIPQASEEYP